MNFCLEVIGFTIAGCLTAQAAGANRIELCDNADEGGTTPSYGFIKIAREKLQIDLYPMIRPRGGDFIYSDDEFAIMKADIRHCKELGCNGIVIGALMENGEIDKKKAGVLVNLAYPLGVTFHRAFDSTPNPFEALEDIIDIGCERILTSGQRPRATEGVEILKQLIKQAEGRITIMPGSGINASNIASVATATGAMEFHASARIRVPGNMAYKNPYLNENTYPLTIDAEEVKRMIHVLNALQ